MTDDLKLLNCPFCGVEAECFSWSERMHAARCLRCSASVTATTKEAAIAAWNTRPTLKAVAGEKTDDRHR